MLGGAWDGTRLSKPYREAVGEEEILAEMRVLIKRYATERLDGERFGDFVIRVGIVKATLEGKHFCKCLAFYAASYNVLTILFFPDDDSCMA